MSDNVRIYNNNTTDAVKESENSIVINPKLPDKYRIKIPVVDKFTFKWTEDKAKELFNKSYQYLIDNEDIIYMGTVAVDMGIYRAVYDYIIETFSEKSPSFYFIKKVMTEICESRLIDKAMSMRNPVFAMFLLKCHHNYIEPSNQTDAEFIIRLPNVSNDEKNKIAKNIKDKFL